MLYILLSTYNGERYLAEQLDSIIAQTYTDWRLFVRDDGSADGTLQIIDKYAQHDKRITRIQDEENIGACLSFERLLEQCGEADYYAFADQDDVWRPNKLAFCLSTIQEAEQLYPNMPIVVHSDLQVVDEQLQEMAPSFWQYSNIHPDLVDNRLPYLAICNSVTGCAMLFNRQARTCSLPFSKDAYMHDAWIALMTLYHGGKVIPLKEQTIAYRQHRGNVLGAVNYTLFGRNLARRKYEARVVYRRARGYVFRNKVHFIFWKTIYHIHRIVRNRS